MPAKRKRSPVSVAKAADTRTRATWEKKHKVFEKANHDFQAERRKGRKRGPRGGWVLKDKITKKNALALKRTKATSDKTYKVEEAALKKWITANNKLRVAQGKRALPYRAGQVVRSDGTPRELTESWR